MSEIERRESWGVIRHKSWGHYYMGHSCGEDDVARAARFPSREMAEAEAAKFPREPTSVVRITTVVEKPDGT